ncbi:MAG: hypothetical protein Q7V63_09640 [Gammaproteobacteria bacterium]|nr:hypothetical protein [Gammaproteobacteria bacterium]
MKKLLILTLCSLPLIAVANCSLNNGGYQANSISFDGPTTCSGGQADAISVNGPLLVSNEVISTLSVNGPIAANHAKVSSLSINGQLNLHNSTVDTLTINGALQSVNSTISSVNAQGNLRFVNSTVGNIVIPHAPSAGHYTIYLQGKTVVNGNINFQEGGGIVYQSSTAKVTGTITGASVKMI